MVRLFLMYLIEACRATMTFCRVVVMTHRIVNVYSSVIIQHLCLLTCAIVIEINMKLAFFLTLLNVVQKFNVIGQTSMCSLSAHGL